MPNNTKQTPVPSLKEAKKTDRKYKKAENKIAKAKNKNPKRAERVEKKYGYDYDAAKKAGVSPDETGHWPSRDPSTGRILKGRKHPTIDKTKKAEKEAGYKMYKKDGNLYSRKRKNK